MKVNLINADVATVPLDACSFDAVLCDPPYGLEFMNQGWDQQVPPAAIWMHIAQALKPGAPLLAFGGTRTWHHLATSIEQAGFEIRDSLAWLYGQGFPKSQDASKAIDKRAGATRKQVGTRTLTGSAAMTCKEKGGTYASNTSSAGRSIEVAITEAATPLAKEWEGYGTALKPAHEPIILARKPMVGTLAENIERHGVGALNIDACRVHRDPTDQSGWSTTGSKASSNRAMSGSNYEREPKADSPARFPANVLLDEESAALLDAQSGNRKSTPFRANDATGLVLPFKHRTAGGYQDDGGASRFFYTAKASKSERAAYNNHPTVKPIALTRYLATLLLPPSPDAHLLIPFAGSGSEVLGAIQAGWRNITAVEINAHYLAIARQRIDQDTSIAEAYKLGAQFIENELRPKKSAQ